MAAVDTAPHKGAEKTQDADAPVTYTLEQMKILTSPKTRRYWIGVYHYAPLEHTDAGGVSVMNNARVPPDESPGTPERYSTASSSATTSRTAVWPASRYGTADHTAVDFVRAPPLDYPANAAFNAVFAAETALW